MTGARSIVGVSAFPFYSANLDVWRSGSWKSRIAGQRAPFEQALNNSSRVKNEVNDHMAAIPETDSIVSDRLEAVFQLFFPTARTTYLDLSCAE